jgi:hypothetical protein
MPDDKQSAHADKIRFERNFMDHTGLTRSQARESLVRFAEARRQAIIVANSTGNKPFNPTPVPTVEQKFEPSTIVSTSTPATKSVETFGEWRNVTDCDGNTFDVQIRNFVAAE